MSLAPSWMVMVPMVLPAAFSAAIVVRSREFWLG